MLFDKVKVSVVKKKKLPLFKPHELHLKLYIFHQIKLTDDWIEAKRVR